MGWINVEEEKPPFLRKVLFLWVCPGGNKNVSMGYLCGRGWDIYLPYHSYKLHNERITVTHWRELPEYPTDTECTHEDINMEPAYQCEGCKEYVSMD